MEYPTKRDLDGVYFRVKRGDKMVTLCVSDMTTEELTECCNKQDKDFIVRLCCTLASTIHDIGEELDIYGQDSI